MCFVVITHNLSYCSGVLEWTVAHPGVSAFYHELYLETGCKDKNLNPFFLDDVLALGEKTQALFLGDKFTKLSTFLGDGFTKLNEKTMNYLYGLCVSNLVLFVLTMYQIYVFLLAMY